MARFLGSVCGGRGEASRLGHRYLNSYSASWQGAVRVELYRNSEDRDCARIAFCQHHGCGGNRVIYDGPVDGSGECAR